MESTVGRSRRPQIRLGPILVGLALIFAAMILLAPVAYTLATSFREPRESFRLPPEWIPTNPSFNNYRSVFDTIPLGTYFLNSTIITGSIVIGQLITAALAGYAFGRLDFPGRNAIFWIVLATMMIPLQATIIPVFVLISEWNLSDTRTSLILPAIGTAFGTFLMRQYFMQMPHEYEQAALVDGASQWSIFYSIYLPMAKGGLAVLAILSFNGHWNEFLRPLIFLKSVDNFTLPLGLVNLQGYMGTGSVSVVMAGVLLSLLPVLVIYMFGQKYLVEGLMVGGLKG
jgi:multiple sugar transport system permease protein